MHKKKERLEDNGSKKDSLHHTSNTKTMSKVVKSEFAIKPGRQDEKLITFGKKCAYGECQKCGVEGPLPRINVHLNGMRHLN